MTTKFKIKTRVITVPNETGVEAGREGVIVSRSSKDGWCRVKWTKNNVITFCREEILEEDLSVPFHRGASLDDLQEAAHDNAKSKGWWESSVDSRLADAELAAICMAHSQLSEILERARKNRGTHIDAEIGALWSAPSPMNQAVALSTNQQHMLSKIALMHSELSEAAECVVKGDLGIVSRDGKPEGLPVELADVVIRVLDFCGGFSIDLLDALIMKHKYNRSRPHRHGGKRA